jgi:hypothetical protein
MKYAVEMGSGAMTYIPSFIKIGSGNHKLRGERIQTQRQHGDLISLLRHFMEGLRKTIKCVVRINGLGQQY